jgi:hypothetical protein
MKVCSKCGEPKDLTSFAKKRGKYAAHCKPCQRKMWLSWYAKPSNKQRHLQRNAKLSNEARQKLLELVQACKDVPCADCQRKYPSYVMDFDHVRGTKVMSVSTLINSGSKRRLLKEIEKCEVVCSNCHRIRTHTRRLEHAEGARR